MESVLRPRDIQARIRAGEAPEDVALAAQTSVDRIMGFATPVLAERAYQAQLAQRASVRRRAAAGPVGNLGGAVSAHLERLEIDPESVEWDSWRREDGRWTVVASYVLAQGDHRQAAFAYDAAGRFVIAEDDEARTLVGERTAAPPEASAPTPRSLSLAARLDEPLSDSAQIRLGDDALEVVMGIAPASTSDPTQGLEAPEPTDSPVGHALDPGGRLPGEITLDLAEHSRVSAAPRAPSPAGGADWISTQASGRPEATESPRPNAPRPDGAPESEPWDTPGADETVEEDAREEEQGEVQTLFDVPEPMAAAGGSTGELAASAASAPAARAPRPRRRASVPSWDEIMFGADGTSD